MGQVTVTELNTGTPRNRLVKALGKSTRSMSGTEIEIGEVAAT